jgi:hypothetical protein
MCVTDIFLNDMYVNDSHEGEGGRDGLVRHGRRKRGAGTAGSPQASR